MSTKKPDAEPTKLKKVSKKQMLSDELKTMAEQGIKRTPEQAKEALSRAVRIFYDFQRLRLQTGGRTQKKAPGAEAILHDYDMKLLDQRTNELLNVEKLALSDVEELLKEFPIYTKVLSDKERFRGIGPTLAGVILAEFDIVRADTPSKMWAFAGLAPVAAFRCKSCNRTVEPLEEADTFKHSKGKVWIVDKNKIDPTSKAKVKSEQVDCSFGEESLLTMSQLYASGRSARPTKGIKLNYNAWLRSKMLGVLAGCLIKSGSPYRKFYDEYKHRWESAGKGVNDNHRHKAALRFMVKMVLLDIWREWRTIEGLTVREPYSVEFLHKTPHIGGTTENNSKPLTSEQDFIDAEIEEELKRAI